MIIEKYEGSEIKYDERDNTWSVGDERFCFSKNSLKEVKASIDAKIKRDSAEKKKKFVPVNILRYDGGEIAEYILTSKCDNGDFWVTKRDGTQREKKYAHYGNRYFLDTLDNRDIIKKISELYSQIKIFKNALISF